MVFVVELAELFVVADVELYAVDVEFVYQLVIELAEKKNKKIKLKKINFHRKKKLTKIGTEDPKEFLTTFPTLF